MTMDRKGASKISVSRLVLTAVAAVVALLFFLPFAWMMTSAVRPADEIFRFLSPLSVYSLIPKTLTAENFARPPNNSRLSGVSLK